MGRHYKVKTPNGLVRKFINTGDGFAEREIADYWFEGCEITLVQNSQAFKNDTVRTVGIDEIRQKEI